MLVIIAGNEKIFPEEIVVLLGIILLKNYNFPRVCYSSYDAQQAGTPLPLARAAPGSIGVAVQDKSNFTGRKDHEEEYQQPAVS